MSREGYTKITSVSVSKEFIKLMKEYELSPTEVFRIGLAVSLCDKGIYKYENATNKKRSELAKEFLKHLDKAEDMKKVFNEIYELGKILKEIKEYDNN